MHRHLHILLLFLSLPTLAQEAPPLSTTSDEVIVTGARFTRTQAESPSRVTVIDSATIARSVDLATLLNEQAGITVNGAYSNFGKDRSLFLRNGANQYTLILVDGQPLVDPSSLGGAVDLRLLSLEGLERIEILRGARSLLYGSDAVAGVINLVTSRATHPEPDPFNLHLRAAAQRYGTLEGKAAVSGTTEKLDYQAGYDYFRTDGISEAAPPPGSAEEFRRDGAERQTYYGNLTWRPDEHWTLRPGLRRATFNGDYDAGAFQDGDNHYTNELWLPALSVDYQKETFSAGARYNYAATDRVFDDAAYGESFFRGRAQQADLFVNFLPSEALAVTLGGQYRHERLALEEADSPTATNLSPYLQLNLNVAERLLFETGVRYNHHSSFGGQLNGSAAVGYHITPVVTGRLSVATAFQSPTLDQLYGPFGANPELQPQVSTSYEAGAQVQGKSGRAGVNLALFQRYIDQLIVYRYPGQYLNVDNVRDRGLEVEAFTALGTRLSADGNLTYVRGRMRTTDANSVPYEVTEFYRRPRFTGRLGLTFRGDKPFLARLSAQYTGERPDIFYNAAFEAIPVQLEPYLLVNAYAEYKLLERRNLTVFGEVRNLTSTDFTEVTGFSTLGVTPRVGVALEL